MEKLPMCRICLAANIPMYVVVNKNLHELYKKLTDIPFVTEDSRPILACSICCVKLKQCCRLMMKCLEAEKLFAEMTNENYELNPFLKQDHLQFFGGLVKTSIQSISIVDVGLTESIVKEELPAVSERLDDIIEPKEEQPCDDIKQEHPDIGYSDEDDIISFPSNHFEKDSEDNIPLMEFKPEVEKEQEVSKQKQKAVETNNIKQEHPDIGYSDEDDIIPFPSNHFEKDSEDNIPLMELKPEVEKEQEVSKQKQKAVETNTRMAFTRENGRTAQTIQLGQPASGEQRENRNQRRAYEFQKRRNFQEDWNDVREFENRPVKPRGRTDRTAAWRNAKPKVETDAAVSYDFRAKDETAPTDEPLYDLGPHTSSVPVQEIYSQNFEFGGYIDQIERTYESLRGVDPRLDRRMPYSMFQHSMTTILNCYLMDVTLDNGERKIGSARCQDLLPEDLCIPDNLFHYIASVGNTTTVGGEEVRFNLPNAAIPQAAEANVPAGSFGPLNAENHNLYECYISPLVTSNRVLNSRRAPGAPEVPPLPAILTPPGSTPTTNLLGYGPADVVPVEARPRIEGFEFPDGDTVAARLRICPELISRVNTVLFELRSRYKMRDIGRSSPIVRNYIMPKVLPGNVQFVRVSEATPDVQRLSQKQCQVRSSAFFGSSSAGFNNVTVFRRERNNNASGACYTVDGAIPQGWLPTINNNFNMVGPFAPSIGATNPAIRDTKFVSHSPGGTRITAIDHYIKRNFYIPAR